MPTIGNAPPFEVAGVRSVDPGIRRVVEILFGAGVETFESCEGGEGHSFAEPTVRFHGNVAEGFRAFSVALNHGFRVAALRRYYTVIEGELRGPEWEMTFSHPP